MDTIKRFINDYLVWLSLPKMEITDLVEIIIIAVLIYYIIVWIRTTRAWVIFKGLVFMSVFILIASILNFNVILWIVSKAINVGIIAIVIVFQPELRKALEQLGRKNWFTSLFVDDQKDRGERFSDRTVSEIIRATYELAKTKTGALMVIEQEILLNEYERTGIIIDSVISSQLLINIFEHNTPLHDGAVILKNDRVAAATCYLPLSDSTKISKDLGTRHRAALGISEVTDSLTIIVSEETGKVSIAVGGELARSVDGDYLRQQLIHVQKKTLDSKKLKLWKGRQKNEKKANK